MELQEQVNALNAERKQHIDMINNINSEKIALDQMLINHLKETLNAKKEVIMKDNAINNLNEQIQVLLKEKEVISTELKEVRGTLTMMASEAQN